MSISELDMGINRTPAALAAIIARFTDRMGEDQELRLLIPVAFGNHGVPETLFTGACHVHDEFTHSNENAASSIQRSLHDLDILANDEALRRHLRQFGHDLLDVLICI